MAGCAGYILVMLGMVLLYGLLRGPRSDIVVPLGIVILLPTLLTVAGLGLLINMGSRAVAAFREPSAHRGRARGTLAHDVGRLLEEGQFGEVIFLFAAVHNGESRLRSVLNQRLGAASAWSVARSLRDLAREILLLERSRRAALSYSLPPELTESLQAETRDIADRLWDEAGRLAAVAVGDHTRLPRLAARLDRRQVEIERLRACVQATRDDLAELTLSGVSPSSAYELKSAGDRLRAASAGLRWLSSGDAGDEPLPQPEPATYVRRDAETVWEEIKRLFR